VLTRDDRTDGGEDIGQFNTDRIGPTTIGARGWCLGEVATLRRVDLSMTGITDAAFRSFDHLPKIEFLEVSAANVSAEAVKMFQQTHPKCTI
jgi:hypothetical protein